LKSSAESLWAIGPLDGRYANKLTSLNSKVSEGALISYRVRVEAAWLLHLASVPEVSEDLVLDESVKKTLTKLMTTVDEKSCLEVKEIEATTNHDVKAVEYYLRNELKKSGASDKVLAFIHFACTSEDINNLAYGMMLDEVRRDCLIPDAEKVLDLLKSQSKTYAGISMLSRTHGQTASPTTLGKEIAVFHHRLKRQIEKLKDVQLDGKMSGAVGNYNAHLSAYPNVDWMKVAKDFVEGKLGLFWNPLTTQIENHDSVVEYSDVIRRFNTIAIDLSRDIWGYVSVGYFTQVLKEGEVGSSTMPHKVNPIDFENAEGNFGISSAMASHFADKLPISRWQRDLSDSTVLRAIGTMVGHAVLAMKSLEKGLGKLAINEEAIARDLDNSWEVLGEAVQTVMRRYGVMDAYERLKKATRGMPVTKEVIKEIIDGCDELPSEAKTELLQMTPSSYIGAAEKLAVDFL